MTRTIKQISSLARVQIKENTRNNDDFLFKTSLEEVQSISDSFRKAFKVKPEIEGTIWYSFDNKSHITETLDDIISFILEVISLVGRKCGGKSYVTLK